MSSANEIENNLNRVIQEVKSTALKVMEIEALRSIQKNFESGGRPKWIPSKKKGKLKGTKTLVVTGALREVSAVKDEAASSVTLITSPDSRAYARIQHEGGTISMKPKTMARRTKKDGRSVFASKNRDTGKRKKVDVSFSKAYTIRIPARPFLVIPPEDYPGIVEAIRRAVSK
jgi:phage gpG-like protein